MKSFFFFSLTLLTTWASADWKQAQFDWLRERVPSNADTKVEKKMFEQKLDHTSASDERTFQQRFYIDSSLAKDEASPVLFYLCGEAACEVGSLNGAIRTHAAKLKAHLVALEHRYYGISHPFGKLTTENLKYLTIGQALEDAANFQRSLQPKLKGKWISVGGSYPGSLSAYYRLKHPELVVGALASSGPVKAKEDFEEYDHHVWKVAGTECAKQIKTAVAEVEKVLASDDKEAIAALKDRFEATALVNDDDFRYLVADMGALAVQYGYRDHFCELIKGSDPLPGYAQFTKEIYKSWQIEATSGSVQGAFSEDPKDYPGIGMRQWMYQSCTEYGYWQIAYHDESESVRSKRINLDYHHDACKRLFGITTPVDTKATNEIYYEPLLQPSTTNVLFTNGSQDPWSNLSIVELPASATGLTSYLIDGAAHCDDLRAAKFTDSTSLRKARELFSKLAEQWLVN